MPRLSTWMIRASLIYLFAGFSFGALLLFHKGIPISARLWSLLPAHIDFLLFGWTVQLVMGMAFWILPRFSREPRRGNVWLAWLAFGLLNAGVLFVGLAPLVNSPPVLSLLGRFAQAAAGLAFAAHAWPRVKEVGAG
jgi:heme/copper-type cytochrome/quinol oxidase subunit 1